MPMPPQRITLTIESRLDAVPLLGRLVNFVCSSEPLPAEQRNQVELCVVEAVNNCIKHAYRMAPDRLVEVAVSLFPKRLECDICDSGFSGDPELMRADHRGKLKASADSPEMLAESGRGLAIMQTSMDSVEYTATKGRNCLRLVKHLPEVDIARCRQIANRPSGR